MSKITYFIMGMFTGIGLSCMALVESAKTSPPYRPYPYCPHQKTKEEKEDTKSEPENKASPEANPEYHSEPNPEHHSEPKPEVNPNPLSSTS